VPFGLALGLAALWPVSAYVATPVLLPTLLVTAIVGLLVLSKPEYGLAIVLALAPFTNLQVGSSAGTITKPLHLLLPALVFGVLVYALLVTGARASAAGAWRAHWLTAAVVFFLAVALASAINAIDPHHSIRKLFLLIAAVGAFFGVRAICRDSKQFTVVAAGAVIGLLLASIQGIDQHFRHHYGAGFVTNGQFVGRVQGSFGHPNQYGGYLVFLIPLAAGIALSRRFDARLRLLAGSAAVAAVPAIAFSYARGAILALVLGLLVWFAIVRPRYAVGIAVAAAVIGLLFAPATLRERFSTQASSGDVPLRTDIWGASIDIAQAHPFLGVGLDNFSSAYASLPSTLSHASQRRLLNQSGLIIPPHAQNLYLNTLAEEGVVGIAALALLLLGSFAVAYRGSRSSDPTSRVICLGVGAGLATLALHSILEVTLLSELSLPLFALVAVALSVAEREQNERRQPQLLSG
jgi:O-antigen ligase